VTTLAVPTPLKDANPRPLPWRRMAWITWRHHRIALGGVAMFLGVLAVWLWSAGVQLHHAYAAAIACHPAGSTACSELILNFRVTGGILKGGFVLQPVPALIGAFVSLRPAPSATPGPRASDGGAGLWPSWCCSGSR